MATKKIKELEEEVVKPIIELSELFQLNNMTCDKKAIESYLSDVELQIQNKKLLIDNFNLRNKILELEINQLNNSKSIYNNNLSNITTSYNDYIKNITEKYELPKTWGYNPETGEVITNIN